MACPLRIVLVAVSLVVAFFVWHFSNSDQPTLAAPVKRKGENKVKKHLTAAGRLLLDMFTGKYMYDMVRVRWQNCRR